MLRSRRALGTAMIYVPHRLDEVFAVCDRLAVLRDGRLVGVAPTAGTDPEALVRLIIGRPPDALFVRQPHREGTTALRVTGLCTEHAGPVDLTCAQGEIPALVGLRGAGQEEIGRALFALEPVQAGTIESAGRAHRPSTPGEAITARLGFVAGDRNAESVASGLAVRVSLFLNPLACGHALLGWRRPADETREARWLGPAVALKPDDPSVPIETLSGGNRQKVVIARWMRIGGKVLVLEDPTAGVDVGAKAEIYRLPGEAVGQGLGIVLISTDMEETAQIAHRALVFREGRSAAEIGLAERSVEQLVQTAFLSSHAKAA